MRVDSELSQRFVAGTSLRFPFRVDEPLVDRFAALTGDRSPLHVDEDFAARSIYRRRVVHGMLLVSFLVAVPELHLDGYIVRVAGLKTKFSAPVFPGDSVELHIEAIRGDGAASGTGFRYRILTGAGKDAAVGEFELDYRPDGTAVSPPSGSGVGITPRKDIVLRRLSIDDISPGDTEVVEFAVDAAAVDSLLDMLGTASGAQWLKGHASARSFAESLWPFLLLSTIVGMRLPGETATFLEFSGRAASHPPRNETLRLEARVKHVSSAAKILKIEVNSGPAPFFSAGVSAMVNEPREAGISMQHLQSHAVDLGLRGRVVLITGASRGIGEITAKLFALHGARVVVNYRRSSGDAARIVGEIEAHGGIAVAVQADVSKRDEVNAMVGAVLRRFERIDILVNNAAGEFRPIAYDDLDWDDIQADLDVAVKGAFNCCKAVTPAMLAQGGGKIVNLASIYAEDPPPDQLRYVLSKSALIGLTRSLAVEFAGRNIQVNAVVPSFVTGEFASRIYSGFSQRNAAASPMKRNASREDVAQTIVFLASSFSSYMTGQKVMVTGGRPPFL